MSAAGENDEISDEELVRAVQEGDRAAWVTLFERSWRRLVGLTAKILRDRGAYAHDLAEDAAQDALLKVLLNIHKFNPRWTFRAWVGTIAVNAARDLADKVVRERQATRNAARQHATEASASVGEVVAGQERREAVQARLADLPEGDRKILILHYFLGWSDAAIGEHYLSEPKSTVQSQRYKAEKRFRQRMQTKGFRFGDE